MTTTLFSFVGGKWKRAHGRTEGRVVLQCYTRPSIRPCARACLWRWSIDAVDGFCPSFRYNYYARAHRRWWRVSTVTQLVRLDAKTVAIEITLALTSDWRTTSTHSITLNPLLAVTHLAPLCAPRYPGPGVLWLVIGPPGRAYCEHDYISNFSL